MSLNRELGSLQNWVLCFVFLENNMQHNNNRKYVKTATLNVPVATKKFQ